MQIEFHPITEKPEVGRHIILVSDYWEEGKVTAKAMQLMVPQEWVDDWDIWADRETGAWRYIWDRWFYVD